MKSGTQFSNQERQLRSQLHERITLSEGFLHASLIQMARRCGNPGCKCQIKGEKHVSYYVGQTHRNKTRMKYVPLENEKEVTQWIENYQQARDLLEKLCEERWKAIPKGRGSQRGKKK